MPDNRKFKGRADLGWLGALIGGAAGGNELATDYTSDAGPTQVPTYRAKSPIIDALFNRGRTGAMANDLNAQYGLEGYRGQLRSAEGERERQFSAQEGEKERAARIAEEQEKARLQQEQAQLAHKLGIAAKYMLSDPSGLAQTDPFNLRTATAGAESNALQSEYLLGRQDELNPVAFQGAIAERFKPVADVRAKMLTNVPEGGTVYDPAFPGSLSNVGMRYEGPYSVEKQTGVNPFTQAPVMSKVRTGARETPVYTAEQRQSIDERIMSMYNASQQQPPSEAPPANPQALAEINFSQVMLYNEVAMDTYNKPYEALTPQEQNTVDQLVAMRQPTTSR